MMSLFIPDKGHERRAIGKEHSSAPATTTSARNVSRAVCHVEWTVRAVQARSLVALATRPAPSLGRTAVGRRSRAQYVHQRYETARWMPGSAIAGAVPSRWRLWPPNCHGQHRARRQAVAETIAAPRETPRDWTGNENCAGSSREHP